MCRRDGVTPGFPSWFLCECNVTDTNSCSSFFYIVGNIISHIRNSDMVPFLQYLQKKEIRFEIYHETWNLSMAFEIFSIESDAYVMASLT